LFLEFAKIVLRIFNETSRASASASALEVGNRNKAFTESEDVLDKLADEALAEHAQGKTKKTSRPNGPRSPGTPSPPGS